MRIKRQIVYLFLLIIVFLIGCDSDTSFLSIRNNNSTLKIRANLINTQTGTQIIQITDTSKLSEQILKTNDLSVVVSSNKTTIPVSKGSDGSYSFPLPQGTKIDTDGTLRVIFIIDKIKSEFAILHTGPLVSLGNPPIITDPNPARIIKGAKVKLKANIDSDKASRFTFNWSYKTSSQSPAIPISGTTTNVEWTPLQVGSYFIQLDTVDKESGLSSTYVSPTSIVFVLESDSIVQTDPSPATILEGDEVKLTATLPSLTGKNITYTWSYSQSSMGPFLPIDGNKETISWKPLSVGTYYIRIEAHNNDTNKSTTYTSSEPIVFVTSSDDLIKTLPESGAIFRGEKVKLIANIKNKSDNLRYNWSYSLSKMGPFSPISGTSDIVEWIPDNLGSYFIQVRVFNDITKESKTYTSNKSLVTVSENDNLIQTNPNPGNIFKGETIQLIANIPYSDEKNLNYTWSYSSSSMGAPFIPINGSGKKVNWTPIQAGSYFIKVDVTDNEKKTNYSFISSKALVFVSESNNIIRTEPNPGFINLGDSVTISVNIPNTQNKSYKYSWSYSSSSVGPFFPISSTDQKVDTSSSTTWLPTNEGSYYVKVDVVDTQTGTLLSFTSPTAIVIVNEFTPFFETTPSPAIVKKDALIRLKARFNQQGSFIFSWSFGVSTSGPWTAIGSSNTTELTWSKLPSPGSYYIKFDVINLVNNRMTSFISKTPLVFIKSSDSPSASFGMNF